MRPPRELDGRGPVAHQRVRRGLRGRRGRPEPARGGLARSSARARRSRESRSSARPTTWASMTSRCTTSNPPFDATEDIFVSHEAELTQSGRYVLVTDERGGGILPVRRELHAGRGQHARKRRHPRVPGGQARHGATRAHRRAYRSDRGLPGGGLREELRGRARDLPRADHRRSRRARSAHRTSSSRSPARTGSSWAGTRRALRSSTSPRTPTARSTSSGPASSCPSTRTSGSRTSSRSRRTPTVRSPTGARPATSCSETGAATRSTSTR